jgi:hypothetical protein
MEWVMATINYRQIDDLILQCEIDLKSLYPDHEFEGFQERFQDFKKSHDSHNDIFRFADQKISYKSEQLIPNQYNSKPFLLMVFGNPASHSIKAGMFFSHEGEKREHRFWTQILRDSGIGDLAADANIKADNINTLAQRPTAQLKI